MSKKVLAATDGSKHNSIQPTLVRLHPCDVPWPCSHMAAFVGKTIQHRPNHACKVVLRRPSPFIPRLSPVNGVRPRISILLADIRRKIAFNPSTSSAMAVASSLAVKETHSRLYPLLTTPGPHLVRPSASRWHGWHRPCTSLEGECLLEQSNCNAQHQEQHGKFQRHNPWSPHLLGLCRK